MLRILYGAAAFALFAPWAYACEGQTGKVIFEDKFTDDSGGWSFGEDLGLVLKAPGAMIKVDAADGGSARTQLNETFTASQGDFCAEMSFPPDAAQLDARIGVVFLGADYSNYWMAEVFSTGKVALYKKANSKWSTVWETATNNLVKTGPADVNSLRVAVKNGTVAVILNGQTVKNVRAQIPNGDLKFGVFGEYYKPSASPVWFPVRSYKVTAAE
ncbi:MAG: hypothetical protein L0Y57_08245 [Beijerinckiaceae bacterium]|nr:hypothetical protein [Beijerinckiaceae bacterium]